jgi:hypothetical protein
MSARRIARGKETDRFRRERLPIWVLAALIFLPACRPVSASPDSGSLVEMNWGGHLRAIATATEIDDRSVYQYAEAGPYVDAQAEMRLKNEIFIGDRWTLETHYEFVAAGGETFENTSRLRDMLPGPVVEAGTATVGDDRRFFNLTRTVVSDDDRTVYHRLDRFNLPWPPPGGSLRIGRQALTWGNGMVFNPMDLFNPFSPDAVQRDYKTGDDMVLGQATFGRREGQVLYAPRRDAETGELSDSRSSLAGKLHWSFDALETDLLLARHYDDRVFGWGATGTVGDAAWRVDALYTRVDGGYRRNDYLQAVANLDVTWVWGGKNVYGLVELYYNGMGRNGDYARALSDAYTVDRLSRGDLFALGRCYLAGMWQIELHPLLRHDWTAIVNLEDPSGLLMPQLLWDVTADTRIILGAQWNWGARGTEYGGYDMDLTGCEVSVVPFNRVHLWVTRSF